MHRGIAEQDSTGVFHQLYHVGRRDTDLRQQALIERMQRQHDHQG